MNENQHLLELLISLITGLIGGSGIVGGIFFYVLKRREIVYRHKTEQIILNKVRMYVIVSKLLRKIGAGVITIEAAKDELNIVADELILWSSDKVYKEIIAFFRLFAKNPSLSGTNFETHIAPIIIEMAKDLRGETTIIPSEILAYAVMQKK